MTTKAITEYKIEGGKFVRKITFRAGLKRKADARRAKAWQGKSKRAT